MPDGRLILTIIFEGEEIMTAEELSRVEQYRDLIEVWINWWNGPGRRDYAGFVIPPIHRTEEILACSICSGTTGDGRCLVCLRQLPDGGMIK